VRPTDEVNSLINCLTNDEDIRQDLWVCYLSGTPVESFESRLERIKVEYSDDLELRKSLWQLINNPPSETLSVVLQENFTDYERSIICCLMLGLTASKISYIKGISEVRIRQSIATIRYNDCWEVTYGAKEKSDRRRTIRS
jgi:hypothetical protein